MQHEIATENLIALQIVFNASATEHSCNLVPTRIRRGLRIQ